jgi:2-haloacid dehalogenase
MSVSSSAYRWLLFDADNTLLDFNKSSAGAFRELIEWVGITWTPQVYQTYLTINDECWRLLELGRLTADEVKQMRFERLLKYLNRTGDPKALNTYYLDRLAEQKDLVPDALSVLNHFSNQGFTLAIITNGLQEVQYRRLRATGIDHFFESIIISDEIGIAKPHVDFFHHTLSSLKHPPEDQVLVIGDNPHSDILGGHNAGLDTCWYNPKQKENPLAKPPTFEIQTLTELIPLVF